MGSNLIINGQLHAPSFIFVRCAGNYSDADLLRRFGLSGYRPREWSQSLGCYAILADNDQWTMIADDWLYTLWQLPSTRPAIEELGMSCDVFACSVGDCDRSFDFVYYRGSELIRRYVVADPDFYGGRVVEEVGEPLPGEAAALRETDELKIVMQVAASLGIRTDYAERELRVYAPFAPDGQ